MQVDLMILPSCGAPQKNTLTFPFFSLEILSNICSKKKHSFTFLKNNPHLFKKHTNDTHLYIQLTLISAIRLVFIIIAYVNVQCINLRLKIAYICQRYISLTITCKSTSIYFAELEINGTLSLLNNLTSIIKKFTAPRCDLTVFSVS